MANDTSSLYSMPSGEMLYSAFKGDNSSIEQLLSFYDSYINRLCTMYVRDSGGNLVRSYIDEDKKQIVSMAFVSGIRNFAKLLVTE